MKINVKITISKHLRYSFLQNNKTASFYFPQQKKGESTGPDLYSMPTECPLMTAPFLCPSK